VKRTPTTPETPVGTSGLLSERSTTVCALDVANGLRPKCLAPARASTTEPKPAHGCRAVGCAVSSAESGIVLEWPRRRKLVPRLRDVETGARARCRADGCSKLACFPDARCALHTVWLSGGASERIAGDSWTAGPAGHRRAQAWALWRVRMGLPSGDVFVPLLPEET
jgi:hypothetical protein